MKIAIVGAGMAGIATACELASDGHAVTVFERRGAAAEEASFGHAGLVAPACMVGHLGSEAIPVRGWEASPGAWSWRRRQHGSRQAAAGTDARLALARLSQERLRLMAGALELHYQRADGVLVLMRSAKERRRLAPLWEALRGAGLAAHEAGAAAIRTLEPGLNADTPLAGAMHLPGDEVGNCRQFALLLKAEAERHGVIFHFGTTVERVEGGAAPALRLQGHSTPWPCDAVVLCAGTAAPALLRPLGLHLPFATLHGYSVSAPIREPLHAPGSAVVDAGSGATIVRLGDRVRVAGAAHFGNASEAQRKTALQSLYRALHTWFPGAARLVGGLAQEWHGQRLVLPDGRPLLGASGTPGVWLHLAHGGHGWTGACGAARLVADAMAGETPAVPLDAFSAQRFR
ncbi:FAD-dependent oxidoreductase [Xylophilus sp. ASV27]|uniref:FAD-dependent oxidoreductase n=1 Tax=Xylophilus sp. ASV27 TaxID=2795129 RepID=UPI0018EB0AA4|nr:FAD-dependent oxidoreductase [Xylophilus sp. ASV27]